MGYLVGGRKYWFLLSVFIVFGLSTQKLILTCIQGLLLWISGAIELPGMI